MVVVHDAKSGMFDGKVIVSGSPDQIRAAQRLVHAFILCGKTQSWCYIELHSARKLNFGKALFLWEFPSVIASILSRYKHVFHQLREAHNVENQTNQINQRRIYEHILGVLFRSAELAGFYIRLDEDWGDFAVKSIYQI